MVTGPFYAQLPAKLLRHSTETVSVSLVTLVGDAVRTSHASSRPHGAVRPHQTTASASCSLLCLLAGFLETTVGHPSSFYVLYQFVGDVRLNGHGEEGSYRSCQSETRGLGPS